MAFPQFEDNVNDLCKRRRERQQQIQMKADRNGACFCARTPSDEEKKGKKKQQQNTTTHQTRALSMRAAPLQRPADRSTRRSPQCSTANVICFCVRLCTANFWCNYCTHSSKAHVGACAKSAVAFAQQFGLFVERRFERRQQRVFRRTVVVGKGQRETRRRNGNAGKELTRRLSQQRD